MQPLHPVWSKIPAPCSGGTPCHGGTNLTSAVEETIQSWRYNIMSRQELRIFLFTTVSRPALRPTQPPIQWVPGALSLGVKRPGHEADHSSPSSTEVKNVKLYLRSPDTPSWRGSQLKHRDDLTFTFCNMSITSGLKDTPHLGLITDD
jgi:hypothetical protein